MTSKPLAWSVVCVIAACGGRESASGMRAPDDGSTNATPTGGGSSNPNTASAIAGSGTGSVTAHEAGGNVSAPIAGAPGTAGGGGTEPNQPCTGACPSGRVWWCSGLDCPLGECQEIPSVGKRSCTGIDSPSVGSSWIQCKAASGGYCLAMTSAANDATPTAEEISYWAVQCVDSIAKVARCSNGCELFQVGATAPGEGSSVVRCSNP